ncbi:MAG: LLM class flavin-dependent oxidoreductase [Actinomycetota bacterium]|nr:LLM class flavin-dependent oxidoreductase [Actinomycetota bacterium]
MRLGITPPVEMAGVAASVEVGALAEALGYTDVFSSEVGSADAFSPLAALAVKTAHVRLGTALVPVFTRPPALLAMTAASMQALSGGRFVLGIGTSTRDIVERWMGLGFERPVERVRDYVDALRRILSGDKVSFEGRTVRIHGFRRQTEPAPTIPIHVGALGPRMCRLAGSVADGVQFALMSPEGVRNALGEVRAGLRQAGRDPADFDVVLRIPIAVDEPPEPVRFLARRLLTGYAIVPTYTATLARQGFGEPAAAVVEAWQAGDRARAVSLFPEAMVDAFFVHGTADECSARLEAYGEAGVRTAILMHLSVAPTPEERAERIAAQLRALAPSASA